MKKVLILDYSVDRLETPTIKNCLSQKDCDVEAFFINDKDSFPIDLIKRDYTHIIHTGSALSITEEAPFTSLATAYILEASRRGLWQMGICYGHQLVCKAFMGSEAVRSSLNGFEIGWGEVAFTENAQLLFGVQEVEKVWQHHFDEATILPAGSEVLAQNNHSPIQAYINLPYRLLGMQFHPEFNRTTGNKYFSDDRDFIEKNGGILDDILLDGPTFNSSNTFFDFFLSQSFTSKE